MNTRIRTRFAPSPTGNLHIGGARSALYNYLWAKKNGGQFLLRIEDTDKTREKEGSLQTIMDGLRWLGIEWDEGPEVGGTVGPYIQSQRMDIYKEYALQLLKTGHAYYCFCTQKRLEEMRKEQQARKEPPRYDRYCKTIPAAEIAEKLSANTPHVLRLAVPETGSVTITDALRGEITFDVKDIDDQVLMKSDGYPTYHLANVVDDHLMNITHVIRAEEWLPSTPKHVLLYQFFGWEAPEFVHLTVFLSKEGGKMSKRHGETSLLAFRDKGYLPEATVNFMALLGWNPKTEEEFFSMEELVQRFDIHMINISNPMFETEKLDWMNQQYMKRLSIEELKKRMKEMTDYNGDVFLYKQFVEWFDTVPEARQQSIWESLAERSKTLEEAAHVVDIVNVLPEYDTADLVWKKSDAQTTLTIFDALMKKLEIYTDEQWLRGVLEPECIEWIKNETEWGNGDVLWPMRFALSGAKQSPSPFELAEILGKSETLRRLILAKEQLQKNA